MICAHSNYVCSPKVERNDGPLFFFKVDCFLFVSLGKFYTKSIKLSDFEL